MSHHSPEETPITLPVATPADSAPPLLFLAPEFWGARVAERRVERRLRPGTVPWAELSEGEPLIAAAAAEAPEVDLDEVLRLTSAPQPLPPSPRGESRRSAAAAMAARAVSAIGLTAALGLSGYAVVSIALEAAPDPEPPSFASAIGTITPVAEPTEAARVELELKEEPFAPRALLAASEAARGGWYTASIVDLPDEAETAAEARRPERRSQRRAARAAAAPALHRQAVAFRPTPEPPPVVEESEGLPGGMMRIGLGELLPGAPTPADVSIALRRVAPLVRNCGAEGARTAPVSLTVQGDSGRVTAVQLRGPLAGTTEGDCIERALERARFPRFAAPSHRLSSYPLVLR